MPHTARRTVAASSIALGVVALLGAGAVAGLVLAPEHLPASVTATGGPALVAVTSETFDDARQVAVRAEQTTGQPLTVRDEGLVTRTTCAPGAVVTSGSSPLTVDDRPVVALATSEPLWRDLAPGATGSDVTALQAELARLGHAVRPDGRYGAATVTAVKAVQRAAGTTTPTGSVSAASVLWLPSPEVTLASCGTGLAQAVGDAAFATTVGAVTALTVVDDVTAAVPGDRVVRVGDAQAPVGPDGRVTDPAFLETFARSPEWRAAQPGQQDESAGTEAPRVTVTFALAAPVEALVVPPAALYALDAGGACVLGDAGPVAVRVVSSALGKSLVVADGAAPARVEVPQDAPPSCR